MKVDPKEIEYRERLLKGYVKSPELLSRVIARVFWNIGKQDHLLVVDQMITDVEVLVGDNLMKLCDDIALKVLEYAGGKTGTD